MAINYQKMAAVAQKLISANGRTLTLLKFQPSTESDTPWKQDTQNPVGSNLDKQGVVVYSNSLLGTKQVNDDMLKRVSDVAILSCNGVSLKGYDAIIDQGVQYSIIWTQELQPATIPLIAYVGYNR